MIQSHEPGMLDLAVISLHAAHANTRALECGVEACELAYERGG